MTPLTVLILAGVFTVLAVIFSYENTVSIVGFPLVVITAVFSAIACIFWILLVLKALTYSGTPGKKPWI